MSESHFLQARQSAELIGQQPELQRHFHTNLPVLLPDLDVWETYRNPQAVLGAKDNARHDFTEAMTTLAFYESPAAPDAGSGDNSKSYSLASTENKSAKKEDSPNLVVFAFEIAAAGLLVRLGLKHLAKNGAKVVGEAGETVKGIGAKLQATPKAFAPSSIADLPNSGGVLLHSHPLPRIRTTERETGPLRVG